jgi:hypothetical protein
MALGRQFRRPLLLAATLALFAAFSASPARADRCEDTAKELKNQIDGLKISVNTGNMIYLTHPAAKELSLGCRGRNYSVELYAKSDRKPKPQFFDLVATAGAIIFTIPKPDALHQADGPAARRQDFDALPPPQHGMHAHQDRGFHRGDPRQGRVG